VKKTMVASGGFLSVAVLCLCCPLAVRTQAQQPPAFTTFDAPGAGTGTNQGTVARGINTAGTIAWGLH